MENFPNPLDLFFTYPSGDENVWKVEVHQKKKKNNCGRWWDQPFITFKMNQFDFFAASCAS